MIESEFGIKTQFEVDTSIVKGLSKLPPNQRGGRCMEFLATQRAFERTFMRLHESFHVYLATWARNSQFRIWKPCRRVFNKETEWKKNGICKKEKVYPKGRLGAKL